MSDSQQSSQSLSNGLGIFAKLAPIPEQKPKLPAVNLLLKKSLDRELQQKFKAKQRKAHRERSRSRERIRSRREIENQPQKQAIIVISDDEEEQDQNLNKFKAMQKGIYDPIQCYEEQEAGMTYRQKRKIDRLLERGMRHFREGKVRDQLSFQIFNTIETYFK